MGKIPHNLYTTYSPCLLVGYILPTTFQGNQKQPLMMGVGGAESWKDWVLGAPGEQPIRQCFASFKPRRGVGCLNSCWCQSRRIAICGQIREGGAGPDRTCCVVFLKILHVDPLKMYSLLKMGIFHCYLSLPEGKGIGLIHTVSEEMTRELLKAFPHNGGSTVSSEHLFF